MRSAVLFTLVAHTKTLGAELSLRFNIAKSGMICSIRGPMGLAAHGIK